MFFCLIRPGCEYVVFQPLARRAVKSAELNWHHPICLRVRVCIKEEEGCGLMSMEKEVRIV